MWKTFVFASIFTIVSLACYCQKRNAAFQLSDYADTNLLSDKPAFYILELNSFITKPLENSIITLAARKFSDSLFIVDSVTLSRLTIPKQFIKMLVAANNQWKLSPSVKQLALDSTKQKKAYHFAIQLQSKKNLNGLLSTYPYLKKKISILPEQNIISLLTNYDDIEKVFLQKKEVLFIDILPTPKEELGTPGFDFSVNKVNLVHDVFPNINGQGQHVSVKEDYYDTTDIDLKGRLDASPLASKNSTNHANFIATIIAGAGNSVWYARGVADEASISSSSFEQVLPDAADYYLQQNISVQNHSYGTIIDNNYGLSAVAFDKSANDNENLLHIFSSGNMGTSASTAGIYSGIDSFANLTGNFKMAKNIITVGAVDSFNNIVPLSSRGPAYDGRIKPDLVAFQKNGTSESAALVSGTALLLQQYYKTQNADSVCPSALAKAILINTADDIHAPGPHFSTGYGSMNAMKAMQLIKDKNIFGGTITHGATQSFSINVPENTSLIKVTLAWNDPAASALSPQALVNDLDLMVNNTANGTIWKPWVLNSYANADSLNKPATRKRDSLNNIEQVSIDKPLPGNYDIHVTGFNVPAGTQKYYVAFSFDTLNFFKWQRLTTTDFAEAGTQTLLRWDNLFPGKGDIEYSYASTAKWVSLTSNIDLSKNNFYWNTPDTIAKALVRMKIGGTYFNSDTFFITTLIHPKAGLVCNDSVLVYWNKIKGIEKYQVLKLGAKYMEPVIQVTDTVVLLSKNILVDKFIAVAPVLPDGAVAPKSYAFNYTLQGAGCYINSFLAEITNDAAKLTLSLGTIFRVASISFEKETLSGFMNIFSSPVSNQLQYTYEYKPLSKGITYFRVKIILNNGEVMYSSVQPVFYVEPGKHLLLPVPVRKGNNINLYTTLPNGEIIRLFDVMGRMVLQKEIQSAHEVINTSVLQAGEYFYRISKNGVKVYAGKVLIQ